jgi:hypothetical protein
MKNVKTTGYRRISSAGSPPQQTSMSGTESVVLINSTYNFQNMAVIDSAVRQIETPRAEPVRQVIKVVNPATDRVQDTTPTFSITHPQPASRGFIAAISQSLVTASIVAVTSSTSSIPIFTPFVFSASAPSSPSTPSFLPTAQINTAAGAGITSTTPSIESVPGADLTTIQQAYLTSTINVVPTRADEDSEVFGTNSWLDIPVSFELSEMTVGLPLLKWEKPRVIYVVSEIGNGGFCRNNAVLIKKLTSPRANINKYIIHRKDSFKENSFSVVGEFTSENLIPANEYRETIEEIGFSVKDMFVFKDLNLKKNSNYIYKVECLWTATGPEPINFDLNNYFSLFTSGSLAFSFLT